MIANQDLRQNVMLKLQGCFELLSVLFSRGFEYLYKAVFDYDPILNNGFLRELLSVITDESLHIVYVDIRNTKVQKHVILDPKEPSIDSRLESFSVDHLMLHDCQVEGSYFISIDSGDWVVFYDAESDVGVILSDKNEVMTTLFEYIVQ